MVCHCSCYFLQHSSDARLASVCSYNLARLKLDFQQVCVDPHPSAFNATLPTFAAERACSWYAVLAPATIDRYLVPAQRSAANPPAAAATVDRWDRQTDGHPTDT